jgi:putative PIN family toxin of toxin-antitoxin system
MSNKPLKIVVDTNLWVSMAMGSRVVSEQMLQIIENPAIELFTSAELLEELTETLKKSRLQKYLTYERTKYLFDLIWLKTQLIHVTVNLQICRDPKDDFIINLATEANVQYIITGDIDLLVLNSIGTLEILTIAKFLEKIK